MFEKLMLHGAALAHRAAEARRASLAEALGEDPPEGVSVKPDSEGVALEGRDLRKRSALDPGLRWLPVRLAQGERGRRR